MQTADSAHMRLLNSNLILKMIWTERLLSRAEIARRTGLARSTVSEIVNQLLSAGLIAEVGSGKSEVGRRPILLQFNSDAFGIIGLDMGVTHVSAVITNLHGKVLAWQHAFHDVRSDPDGTIAKLKGLIDACLEEAKLDPDRLIGIGIGVPSPVDPNHPIDCLSPLILPRWKGYDLRELFSRAFRLPVHVDNDANLGALAEYWWGKGKGTEHLAFIKVGSGIGAGLIFKGEVYRGARGMAGEIGHMVIDTHLSSRSQGHVGGLIELVGAAALVSSVRERLAAHPESRLAQGTPTILDIADAALAGDALAQEIVSEAGFYLGIAVANLLNLFNPTLVAFGGAVTKVGDQLLTHVQKSIRERTLWEEISNVDLTVSYLGEKTIAVGAATQVLQAALNDMSLFPFEKLAPSSGV